MYRRGFGFATLAATLALVGCHPKPSLPDYRYRMTVEVETPQGLKSGSSVIEVSSSIASENAFPTPGKLSTQIHGQAVAVDLGGGRVLFALLSKPGLEQGAESYAFDALYAKPWTGADEYVRRVNEMVGRRDVGVLPATAYPTLVTFGNLRNAKSVAAVDPDHLDAAFGSTVRLRRITVQMTHDAIGTDMRKRLNWLGSQHGQLITASTTDPLEKRMLSTVTEGDFELGLVP